jgi:hypothetical protein
MSTHPKQQQHQKGNPMQIPLTPHGIALVDEEDFECVNRYKWRLQPNGYVARTEHKSNSCLYLHRFLMNAQPGTEVDHRDRDPLNNQKENLRFATSTQQKRNTRKRTGATSRFKGVCWDKQKSKWMVRIYVNSKPVFLGYRDDEIVAARLYDSEAKKQFGGYANLNFTEGESDEYA